MNLVSSEPSFTSLHERLLAYLASNGLKQTRQREEILRAFTECGRHVSIDELLAQVRERDGGIGHATVYRTMRLFVDSGIAAERHFLDGPARYETAAVLDDDHHDHLICIVCGDIVEFENEEIERLQDRVAESHGFHLTSHKMELYGTCRTCTAPKNH
jgi:Fur family ferric uptake transcriptional regulator